MEGLSFMILMCQRLSGLTDPAGRVQRQTAGRAGGMLRRAMSVGPSRPPEQRGAHRPLTVPLGRRGPGWPSSPHPQPRPLAWGLTAGCRCNRRTQAVHSVHTSLHRVARPWRTRLGHLVPGRAVGPACDPAQSRPRCELAGSPGRPSPWAAARRAAGSRQPRPRPPRPPGRPAGVGEVPSDAQPGTGRTAQASVAGGVWPAARCPGDDAILPEAVTPRGLCERWPRVTPLCPAHSRLLRSGPATLSLFSLAMAGRRALAPVGDSGATGALSGVRSPRRAWGVLSPAGTAASCAPRGPRAGGPAPPLLPRPRPLPDAECGHRACGHPGCGTRVGPCLAGVGKVASEPLGDPAVGRQIDGGLWGSHIG